MIKKKTRLYIKYTKLKFLCYFWLKLKKSILSTSNYLSCILSYLLKQLKFLKFILAEL